MLPVFSVGTCARLSAEPAWLGRESATRNTWGRRRLLAGTASVTFRLNRADHLGVQFDFATFDGSAVSPDDYSSASGHLEFAPGEFEKTVEFAIVDEYIDESDETFQVMASNVGNAIVTDGESMVTIVDNDTAPVLTVDDVVVHEHSGTATVTFRLDHGNHPAYRSTTARSMAVQ